MIVDVSQRPVPPTDTSYVGRFLSPLKWPYSDSDGYVTPRGPPASAHIAATSGEDRDVPPTVSHVPDTFG